MAMKLYFARLPGELVRLKASLISLACNELVDQKRMFCQCLCGSYQVRWNEVRHLVAKTQNGRWLDSNHWRFLFNDIFQQFHIANRQTLSFPKQPFGNLGPPAIDMLGNESLVPQPIEQLYCFNACLRVIVICKLVAEEENAPIRKGSPSVCVKPVPASDRLR